MQTWFPGYVHDRTRDVLCIRFYANGEMKEKKLSPNSSCIRKSIDQPRSSSESLNAFANRISSLLPPGFEVVESRSTPGKSSYLETTSGVRFASLNLAWEHHFFTEPQEEGVAATSFGDIGAGERAGGRATTTATSSGGQLVPIMEMSQEGRAGSVSTPGSGGGATSQNAAAFSSVRGERLLEHDGATSANERAQVEVGRFTYSPVMSTSEQHASLQELPSFPAGVLNTARPDLASQQAAFSRQYNVRSADPSLVPVGASPASASTTPFHFPPTGGAVQPGGQTQSYQHLLQGVGSCVGSSTSSSFQTPQNDNINQANPAKRPAPQEQLPHPTSIIEQRRQELLREKILNRPSDLPDFGAPPDNQAAYLKSNEMKALRSEDGESGIGGNGALPGSVPKDFASEGTDQASAAERLFQNSFARAEGARKKVAENVWMNDPFHGWSKGQGGGATSSSTDVQPQLLQAKELLFSSAPLALGTTTAGLGPFHPAGGAAAPPPAPLRDPTLPSFSGGQSSSSSVQNPPGFSQPPLPAFSSNQASLSAVPGRQFQFNTSSFSSSSHVFGDHVGGYLFNKNQHQQVIPERIPCPHIPDVAFGAYDGPERLVALAPG
ncbi:unnamed protein product [Amoebophrya sp. A25]|nr:unnamed protein product [Amoebophrya sp. A25]|eukprot:GSA25T00022948001.1